MILADKKILVTGGAGFLGAYVVQRLVASGARRNLIAIPRSKSSDLRVWEQCRNAVKGEDIVIHLAAKVGGIGFNKENPAELFYDNLLMGIQLMEAARREGVKKFVAIGTVCAYPKFTPVPFKEENLWDGYPEETNAPYGLAKKMLLVQSQAYRAQYGFHAIYLLPVNLYGPGDNFDPATSHVIPALILKILEAKRRKKPYVTLWGSGRPTREFLYMEDAAEAIVAATLRYDKPEPVNLGSGQEISIRALAILICRLCGYEGKIRWDRTRPDGQPRRRLDTRRAQKEFGFKAKTKLEDGLQKTIEWYQLRNLKS